MCALVIFFATLGEGASITISAFSAFKKGIVRPLTQAVSNCLASSNIWSPYTLSPSQRRRDLKLEKGWNRYLYCGARTVQCSRAGGLGPSGNCTNALDSEQETRSQEMVLHFLVDRYVGETGVRVMIYRVFIERNLM